MVTEIVQPTQATEEQAPVAEQAPVSATAVADAGAQAEQVQTEVAPAEKTPDFAKEISELRTLLNDSEARRKGQDKFLTRVSQQLAALKAGSPAAAALEAKVNAMKADIAAGVDLTSPDSATSKAEIAARDTAAQSLYAAQKESLMDEIAERLEAVGITPDKDGIFPVNEDTEDIAYAIKSGEFAQARYLSKELVRRKKAAMTTQTETKPAPPAKTYTQAEVDKMFAERLSKDTAKANRNGLRESGLLGAGGGSAASGGGMSKQDLVNKLSREEPLTDAQFIEAKAAMEEGIYPNSS